jgi:hypothetical protein
LKEVLVELTLQQHPLTTSAFAMKITKIFILGLDALHAHDGSVDLRCRVLRLGQKEANVAPWCMTTFFPLHERQQFDSKWPNVVGL